MILEYHFKCSKTKLQLHRNSWSEANPETSTIPIPTSKVAIETLPTLPHPEIGLRSGFQQGGDEGKTQAHCDEAADQPHHPCSPNEVIVMTNIQQHLSNSYGSYGK